MTKLKSLVAHSDSRRGPGATAEELLSVSIHRGVVPRTAETGDAPRAEDLSSYKSVRTGDLVLNRMRAFQGAVGIARQPGIVSPDYTVLRPKTHVEARYLHHLFRSRWFVGEMVSRLRGIGSTDTGSVRTPRINWDDLRDIDVDIPSFETQRAIADYLDAETARIDAVVAKKQRLTELLDERRVLTTLAGVSGDLTHVGRFKVSTLHWTMLVPEHWDVGLLRLVATQGTGHTPSRDHPDWWLPDECVIPWVTTGEVQQVRSDRVETIYETRERISPAGLANSSAVIHPAGTVFLCRTASAGYSGIMGIDMAVSQDFATWTCSDRLLPEYLLFCLRAMRRDLLDRLATGSTRMTIYMPEIQGIRVPLPPIDEQRAICERVRDDVRRCFAATDALQRQIDLLVEHRQALINSVVQGDLVDAGNQRASHG